MNFLLGVSESVEYRLEQIVKLHFRSYIICLSHNIFHFLRTGMASIKNYVKQSTNMKVDWKCFLVVMRNLVLTAGLQSVC